MAGDPPGGAVADDDLVTARQARAGFEELLQAGHVEKDQVRTGVRPLRGQDWGVDGQGGATRIGERGGDGQVGRRQVDGNNFQGRAVRAALGDRQPGRIEADDADDVLRQVHGVGQFGFGEGGQLLGGDLALIVSDQLLPDTGAAGDLPGEVDGPSDPLVNDHRPDFGGVAGAVLCGCFQLAVGDSGDREG